MKINIDKYDYLMFVDASGCDGVQFDNGSSLCYAVAGYLVKKTDIENDLATLQEMRRIISGDPNRELKYSTLRRHKKRELVFALFQQLKGIAVGRVSFKKELVQKNNFHSEGKAFSVVAHAIAITFLQNCEETKDKHVLIVVDRMKKTEEDPVKYLANNGMQQNITNVASYDLIFRDSKDGNFQLLQIADFISGILREYFELYEEDKDILTFLRLCKICYFNRLSHLCGHKGKQKRHVAMFKGNLHYLNGVFPLFVPSKLRFRISLDPPDMDDKFSFLFCYKQ